MDFHINTHKEKTKMYFASSIKKSIEGGEMRVWEAESERKGTQKENTECEYRM